jgi:hypothetical protein
MRHLFWEFDAYANIPPQDMMNMRKLQSLEMEGYPGSSLSVHTCKFQHLENITLVWCQHLREISSLEWLPNLRCLNLICCYGLKELGIGNFGQASRFLMLEKLVLYDLLDLESIARPSNNGVWNESTLPRFLILNIRNFEKLRRLLIGMNKLINLSTLIGEERWWQEII